MSDQPPYRLTPILLMATALIIWASSFTVGKYAYQAFDAALVVQLRLVVAALIALPFFIKNYHSIPKPLLGKVWLLALLNCPVVLMLQFLGLKYTSASAAVIIVGAEPLFVVVLGYLFFKQKVAWYDWLLSLCAFGGIGLLVLGSTSGMDVSSDDSLLGAGLLAGASVSFALCLFLGKRIMADIPHSVFTAAIMVLGALLCLPFTLLLTQNWQMTISAPSVGAIIYLGVGCSWLAYWLWNKGLQSTPAHISGVLIALEPVFGVLIAMLFLGERMTLLMGIGSGMVISAAILSTLIPMMALQRQKGTS